MASLMNGHPLHDWMRPRLQTLLREAESAGYSRVPAIAVIADIMMDASFNTAPLPSEPASAPVAMEPNPIEPDFDGPSVGNTDWIKPYGAP
jgi:hypothetical protein